MNSNFATRWARRWGPPVGLGVLILIAIVIATVLRRYSNLTRWTTHTHEVIAQVSRVETRVERVETAARGYLLTHEDEFMDVYVRYRREIPADLDRLIELTADNPRQTERLNTFRRAYDAHARRLELLLDEGKKHPGRLVRGRLESLQSLRQSIREIEQEEHQLLHHRQADADGFARAASALLLVAVLVAVFLLVVAYVSTIKVARANAAQASLLHSIFESIGDGLIVSDLDGLITHSNRAAAEILDVTFNRVSTIAELGFLLSVPADQSPTRRALRGEPVGEFELKIGTAAPERVVSVDARPVIGDEKEPVGAIAVLRDVTARRGLENEWRLARESALEASRLKSDFLATMSHEIRTPMNGVIGMATILLTTPLDEDQLSYVNTIKTSADSLLTLINQVLDHAKIESGKLELASADFNVVDMLESVTDLFRYLARSKSLDLRLDLAPNVPAVVRGDVDRLRQVLVNLVGNALKFTDRGHVELGARAAAPAADGRPRLEFSVRDTGRGISPESRERLFQKFSQLGDAHQRLGGTGLGLVISRELVRAMGGEIEVQGAAGIGSKFNFTVTLDAALTCPLRPVRASVNARRLRGRVLVAEDQPINQLVIHKFLEQFGVAHEIVADGEAALGALDRHEFDLVLMDCQMRPMDGYQATARIRAREKLSLVGSAAGRRVPIVALTAEGMSGDRRRCFEVGMDAFLSKPIAVEHLYTMLKKYLTEDDGAPAVTDDDDDATARAATGPGPEFRPEVIAKLDGFESDGRPLVLVLLDEFKDGGARDIDKLTAAAAAGGWDEVRHLAHSLKSSGRTLGLAWFGDVCETLERGGTEPAAVDAEVARLRALYGSGCAWLDQTLQPGRASHG